MKNKIFFSCILFCVGIIPLSAWSQQVNIGSKDYFLSPSSILEFPDNDTRGIVLPKINSALATSAVEGTLIYDVVDKKIKYSNGINQWVDLSINTGEVNIIAQDKLTEVASAKILIGNDPSVAIDGVLVLDSPSKALVLPRVESPHLNIVSPPTGTIVYDTKSNMICVFNGKEWAFWTAE
ncbi:hypothetical protein [Myroides profundi]|uniref:Uncharacterized protein n=1 Tax=Myroides profundi TaxID=480520 RepID=A0AAJ5BES5_MYRPR|nr:hypothetical protein [Myroides profundi]AJH14295.1 hypothetical protein MPR_1106 [Myroides profundi]SER27284.1 hypothetical protein SAMN04488089_1126 [Myroides profundi]